MDHSIKVFGVGGLGCSACEKMMGYSGCDVIAVHTDASGLLQCRVFDKILLGRDLTKGRSTGNNIVLGSQAAASSLDKIEQSLHDVKITFLIAGLGGGTGAGATPTFAEVAKGLGSMVIAFVNIPFSAEGKICRQNAKSSLDNLKPFCDLIVFIENDRFLKTVPDLNIREAFSKVNNMFFEVVTGMVKLFQNSKVETIQPLMSGYATLGYGFGETVGDAVNAALDSPLIGSDITQSLGVLLIFSSNKSDLTGISGCMVELAKKTNEYSSILWTNIVDENFSGVEVMILFTGVSSPI